MRLMLVGDISPGEHYFCFGHGPRSLVERGRDLFDGVRPVLQQADLVIGNLEGPISDEGLDRGDPARRVFRGAPATADQLAAAGIRAVSVANNHAAQHGASCFRDSLARLAAAGVVAAGAAPQTAEVFATARDGSRIALLAASSIPDNTDPAQQLYCTLRPQQLIERTRTLAAAGHVVVVSLHWGREGQLYHDEDQAALAKQLAGAGARIIAGHHPHVLQQFDLTPEGTVVAYSLGNFVFDLPWDRMLRTSAILDVTLEARGAVSALQLWPVRLAADGTPALAGAPLPIAAAGGLTAGAGAHLRRSALKKARYFAGNFWRGDTAVKSRFAWWKLTGGGRQR